MEPEAGFCALDCITEVRRCCCSSVCQLAVEVLTLCTHAQVQDLPHLERRLEAAGNAVTCLALYSRSCGACKDMLRFQRQLCRESSGQLAGAVFLKHNIRCREAAIPRHMMAKRCRQP